MNNKGKKGLWERLGAKRTIEQVVGSLSGPKARAELLKEAGYPGRAPGLAMRLGVELERALPLATDPATLALFGRHFGQVSILAAARAESRLGYPADPGGVPASQVRLSPRQLEERWPWLSGQRALRLARAHRLGRDGVLGLATVGELGDFCRRHPPLIGPAWLHPELAAVRAVNWLLALRLVGDPGLLEPEAMLEVTLHLTLAAQMLSEAVAGPQPQVGCAVGLVMLGRTLNFLPQAKGWLSQGRDYLTRAAGALDRPERLLSAREAGLAAHWLGLARWMGEPDGNTRALEPALAALARYCRAQASPWGCALEWDRFPVRSLLELDPERPGMFYSAANLAAVLADDPELRAGRRLDEPLFWMRGPGSSEELRRLAGGRAPGPGDLPAAGLTWLAAEGGGRNMAAWLRTAPRAGEGGGPPAQAQAQAQAQALDLALVLDGKPVLLPPGPVGEGPMAAALSGRGAYSAPRVDGVEPSGGRVDILALEPGGDRQFMAAAFDGYAGLADPVRLARRVQMEPDRGLVTVVDQVSAASRHQIELFFHFHPSAQLERAPEGGLAVTGPWGRLIFHPDSQCKLEVVRGRDNPPEGWRATAPDTLEPSPTLRLSAHFVGDKSFSNVLVFT